MKKILLLSSILLSLSLFSCSNKTSAIDSNTEDDTQNSDDENSNDETPIEEIDLTNDILNKFSNSNLIYEAKIENSNSTSSYLSSVYSLYSEGRYSFKEIVDESQHITTDVKYFSDKDGNAVVKTLSTLNTVEEQPLVYSSTQEKVKFNDYFDNPFNGLTMDDLTFSSLDNTYAFNNQDKLNSFFTPINYYGETLSSLKLTYDGKDDIINIEYSASTKSYNVHVKGTIKTTLEEVEDVLPYSKESYTDSIENALKEMDEAKSYTYSVNRIDLDGKYPEQNLVTYFTENAILYPADPFTATSNPYGVAKFNDNSIRQFEVIDGKAIAGMSDEFYTPVFDVVAPELYREVKENTYEIDSLTFGSYVAANMANTFDEETLIEYFGLSSKLQITLKDGHLQSFSYEISRIYSDYVVQNELTTVTISNINSTTIDPSLTFIVKDENVEKPKYYGTWTGINRLGNGETHTITIDENSIIFDGIEATEIEFDATDGYTFMIDDEIYMAMLQNDGTLLVCDLISSSLNMIAIKE